MTERETRGRSALLIAMLDALAAPALLCGSALQVQAINMPLAQRLGTRRWLGAALADVLEEAELAAAAHRVLREERPLQLHALALARLGVAERFDVHIAALGEAARPAALLVELRPALSAGAEWPAHWARALAHEVRNPLAGLRGAAQLLRLELCSARSMEYLEVIEREVDRLNGLAERLLAGPGIPERRRFNVHGPLEHARTLAQAEWPECQLQRDYDPSLPELDGDPDRLTQALLNLLRNALQAGARRVVSRTRIERHVRMGSTTHRLAVRIEILDDGPGVPEHLRESLFLPLVTGHAEGSGFGLPVALAIAHELGGQLRFASEPGQTCFWMILPVDPS